MSETQTESFENPEAAELANAAVGSEPTATSHVADIYTMQSEQTPVRTQVGDNGSEPLTGITAAIDSQSGHLIDDGRDKAIRLFHYLRDFCMLRSKVISDINEYEKVIWMADIPSGSGCYSVTAQLDGVPRQDVWVDITNPRLPEAPKPPKILDGWLNENDIRNPELNYPSLNETKVLHSECVDNSEYNGPVEVSIDEFPEVKQAWEEYVLEKWEPWAFDFKEARKIRDVYADIYSLYQKQKLLGESYEIILGLGFLTWQPPEGLRVRRHLITVQINVSFDANRGRVYVTPGSEGLKLTLEQDMLQPDQQPNSDEFKCISGCLENVDELWTSPFLHEALRSWVNSYPENSGYHEDIARQSEITKQPRIHFAPALILRKRTERGLVKVYTDIIRQLEDENNDLPASVWRTVQNPGASCPSGLVEDDNNSSFLYEDVYFPLLANDEQLDIVNNLATSSGVLVQGPPGTGKSHTIANLVCHLLATGQKVLVTSHTARALEVLRDKFERELEDIAPLCVVALGNDNKSTDYVKSSVAKITSRYNSWSGERRKSDQTISALESSLENGRRKESILISEMRAVREIEVYQHNAVCGAYSGTAMQIAQQLRQEEATFGWLSDLIITETNPPLDNAECLELLRLLRFFNPERTEQAELDLVDLDKLMTPDAFADFIQKEQFALSRVQEVVVIRERPEYEALQNAGEERRKALYNAAWAILDKIAVLEAKGESWIANAINQVLSGQDKLWQEMLRITTEYIIAMNEHVEYAAQLRVTGVDGIDIEKIRADARALLGHLKNGGKLGLGPWKPRVVKEALYLIESAKVNGEPCSQTPQLEALITWADIWSGLRNLQNIWHDVVEVSGANLLLAKGRYEHLALVLNELLDLCHLKESMLESVTQVDGISQAVVYDKERLAHLADTARLMSREEDLVSVRNHIAKQEELLRAYATSSQVHAAVLNIEEATRIRNSSSYVHSFECLEDAHKVRNDLERCKMLLSRLQQAIPVLAHHLTSSLDDPIWDHRMRLFEEGWKWRATDDWLQDLINPDKLKRSSEALDATRADIRRITAKLAASKAWRHCLQRLESNPGLVEHLKAWRVADAKIGKGTGKYAELHRQTARREMDKCRSAIPAWIMPIYRVAETINAEPGIFDVVIVDEASQSGPEAMFLLYLAKKIVVVGDSEQIKPTFIVDKGVVNALINRSIPDIPFKENLGVENSFFDYAFIRFRGNIRLREHFRCMPEIIEFSNKLCYSANPLIPLKQYSADRLTPSVAAIHVPEGRQDGTSSRIVNKPEADRIVQFIVEKCKDQEYDGKTIGVISLLGDSQASYISDRLVRELGPKEMENKRIVCGDAYAFQGDERDVIILSMVSAPGDGHRIGVLASQDDIRRFNVAASRAKEQMLLFHTATLNDLSQHCMRYRLLQYCQKPLDNPSSLSDVEYQELKRLAATRIRQLGSQPHPFDSWFEVDVFLSITSRGYLVHPQFSVAGYRVDMVVVGNRSCLAVECDGDHWHGPERYEEDMGRQRQLERSGYAFWRIRGSEYYRNPEQSMESLWEMLDNLSILPLGQLVSTSDIVKAIEEIADAKTVKPAESVTHKVKAGPKAPMPTSLFGQQELGFTRKRAVDYTAQELREAIVGMLSKAPNNSCKKESLAKLVAGHLDVITRGAPKVQFEKNVMRALNYLKRAGRVKEYTAVNVRVKLLK